MTDVVTLKYWYNFDGEHEIIEKEALVIAPSTVVTANGECVSIEVIEKKDENGIATDWQTIANVILPEEIVSAIDFESLKDLSVAEMFRRFMEISIKKA
ncbi:hypothetical protein [Priestia megaterium]|uniref:hypothetical protein n=1 Tax=Priestia megaterium TaxID=1404 RepID=UPI002E1A116A|nr:hypothetical protein [Priestia megaterium]MED4278275.1 hypothetical protein [Priestia megaterium]MED4314380.1 hypothetical protein [Priestia megaterium]